MYHKRTGSLVVVASTLVLLSAVLPWCRPGAAQAPQPAQAPGDAGGRDARPSVAQAPQPAQSPGPATPTAPAAGKTAEPPQEPPTEAERLIDLAIKKLTGLKSASAKFVQKVVMLKQKFSIDGEYRKAPSSRIYQKLTVVGLPDSSGTALQICDGEILWDYQQILEQQVYRKLSIKPIFERLNSPDIDAKTRDQAFAQMGFSGPETLLMGLRRTIKFDQKEEDALDGKPVWVLRGTWRSRTGLVGPDQRALPATGPLPAFVPSLATLYLGKEDGWPYKLVLVGKVPTILQDTRMKGPDGRVIGTHSSIEKIEPSRIELTYSDVQFNPTIPAAKFAFEAPPGAKVDDNTELIIQTLDKAIQFQAMQKRAQADKQDGPILDQPIEIPKPPTDPTPK
jgi:outer membrane lipoprotein-sorting protein